MSTLATDKTRSIKLILWRGSLVLIVIFIWVSPSLRSIIIFEKSLFRLQLTISRKMIFGHIIIGRNKVYLSGGITIALLCHECILSSSLLLHMDACDQSLQGCLILFVLQSLLELPTTTKLSLPKCPLNLKVTKGLLKSFKISKIPSKPKGRPNMLKNTT